ncbi:hypothetical protein PUR49_08195 [Streptomyces sp. BE147]|uniref:hypothetical protein n=1 Tax=Streptomyces sp. BE147 TaxID=3002524 RepID=UPI002E7A65D0|nr:hypothetical protein [Streptomyces sp. BE147]MEE1736479.1 hypothetical protein [Streptomyces sp. BE147]
MSDTPPLTTTATRLPLWDVVIGREDLGPLPDGGDPAHVWVDRADTVRGSDLVVGYFDGQPGGRRMPTAHVGEVCFRALPAPHPHYQDVFTLDGIMFPWTAHDLVLIVPAALAPAAYTAGDRVELIAERRPGHETLTRRYERHGTVTGTADDAVTVRLDGDALPVALSTALIRHVNAESAQMDRSMYD